MGTLPGIGFLEKVVKGDIPGLCVDLGNLLHAEHYIKIYRQVKCFFLQNKSKTIKRVSNVHVNDLPIACLNHRTFRS